MCLAESGMHSAIPKLDQHVGHDNPIVPVVLHDTEIATPEFQVVSIVTFGRLSPFLAALPATIVLLAYAILNGVPFFYPDSFVYFAYGETFWQKVAAVAGQLSEAHPDLAAPADPGLGLPTNQEARPGGSDDWSPAAGRSIYYAVLSGLPGPFPAPWNGVIIQAYTLALVLGMAWRGITGSAGAGYLAAMAVIGLGTTGGIFAATAMPDIWVATGLAALAVLVSVPRSLHRRDRLVLWAIVLFAALVHSSHLAVLLALLAVLVGARVMTGLRVAWRTIATCAVVLLLAVAGGKLGRLAMERAAGGPAVDLPHLTAHLVDGGPGTAFLKDVCPDDRFTACTHVDRLPVEWRTFLFRMDPAGSVNRARIGQEDLSFAIATLRDDPAGVIALALRDAARQVVMIDLATTPIRQGIGESAAAERSPSSIAQRVTAGRLYTADQFYVVIARINAVLAALATVAVATALVRHRPTGPHDAWRPLAGVVATGLVLNAAVCGVLASPYDRFQARVAWLPVFLALILIAILLTRRALPHITRNDTRHDPV